MNKSKYISLSVLALASATLLSCQKERFNVQEIDTNVVYEEVLVKVNLSIGKEQAGTPGAEEYLNRVETKAVDDPVDGTTTAIKDFYLLQFNGVADTCKLIGTAHYYDYAEFISEDNPDGANTMKLVASSSPDAIFILANTCQENASLRDRLVFPQGMTVADLKSRVKSIAAQEDLFGKGDVGSCTGSSFPDDRAYHIMLNAQVNETISSGTTLSISLKRNIARIKVVINNTTATTDPETPVTIKTVSLHNVPNVSYYVNNTVASQPDNVPSSELIQTFNYPDEPYDPAGNIFYVPVNKRGRKDNTTQNTKGQQAPPSSTYLWVDAEYLIDGQTVPITYTFYLGADLSNDYNLLPNNTYTYNITLSKKGNEEYDYRVEDWGPVDFTPLEVERANSYILNPAPTYNRQFKIPIDRIRTFWGGEGMTETTGYEIYDEAKTADQLMNQNFSAFILWTDIEDITDKVTIDMTGHNSGNNAYFTATVAPGTEGNAVVAVGIGSSGSEEIFWSWHLWITNYRPDEVKRYASKENGRYIYAVTGGAMHRYEDKPGQNPPIWAAGGLYEDKFIMDRNLGALDTTYVSGSAVGKGVLYYQFGRKDPLPGPRSVALYYPKENMNTGLKWKIVSSADAEAAFTDATAIRHAVRYPLSFIKKSGAWTSGNKYCPTANNNNIRWQDPNVLNDTGKSLFDPCPPGYKVPKNGTWSNFNAYNATTNPKPTTNISGGTNPPRNLPQWSSTSRGGKNQQGLHYYPGEGDVTNTIFYPASGFLNSGSGAFTLVGSSGYCWSCSPGSATYGYNLYFYSGNVNPSSNVSRAYGFPVRCVQE